MAFHGKVFGELRSASERTDPRPGRSDFLRESKGPEFSLTLPAFPLKRPAVSLKRPEFSLNLLAFSLTRSEFSLKRPELSLTLPAFPLKRPAVSLTLPAFPTKRLAFSLTLPAFPPKHPVDSVVNNHQLYFLLISNRNLGCAHLYYRYFPMKASTLPEKSARRSPIVSWLQTRAGTPAAIA